MSKAFLRLNQQMLIKGISHLASIDEGLGSIVSNIGPPPLWDREQGFSTLLLIILEQQVSLASARAAYSKLVAAIDPATPQSFLKLSDDALKGFGFSRQKMLYSRELSKAIVSGDLDLSALAKLDDETARTELIKIKGIGRWTADIYLLMALLRPDIWPAGDLALAKAIKSIKNLDSIPSPEVMHEIALPWKPWRAVAARILWHYYLSGM